MNDRQRIVVIGGGFAGLNFIKKIDKKKYEVVLVDKNNYHSFPPLFYQVASAGLDASSICFPLRREIKRLRIKNVTYKLGEVNRIDFKAKKMVTQFETIHYDKLVIASGTTNNFFNMPDLKKSVYTLKSTTEAMRACNGIIERLERASMSTNEEERRRLLSFVVIGGGATGVEVAGAIGEMKKYILQREYKDINPDDMTVTLVEGSDRVLSSMTKESSEKALKYLEALMVNVRTGTLMKSYENDVVNFADGTEIVAGMVIWTAGITGVKFNIEGVETFVGPGGRFVVDEYNKIKGLDDVYALGDIALMTNSEYPKGHPQVAQVAIQQAKNLAANLNGKHGLQAFAYRDKGSMATVGRNRAVVDMKHLHFGGRMAWLAWMAVHLMAILGTRKKLLILINWIGAYFTYSSAVRLLLKPTRFPLRTYIDEEI